MQKPLIALLLLSPLMAAADLSVSVDSVRQRFPWNGLVDVGYTISGTDLEHTYSMNISVKAGGVERSVPLNKLPNSINRRGTVLTNGSFVATCDLSASFPEKLVRSARLTAALAVKGELPLDVDTGVTFQPGDYLIWDLTNKTVTVQSNVTSAAEFNTDEYKIGKIACRRVKPGRCYLHGTTGDEGANPGVIAGTTEDFYVCIFPITVAQHALVMGGGVSTDMKMVNNLTFNTLRGDNSTYNWPSVRTVSPDSVIGRMRALLPEGYSVDLPTDAQWERFARAGTRTEYFWGSSSSDAGPYALWGTTTGGYSAYGTVGTRLPNAWGIYEVHGGEWEWTLDYPASTPVSGFDPEGPSTGDRRTYRGGSFYDAIGDCGINYIKYLYGSPSYTDPSLGYRPVVFRE